VFAKRAAADRVAMRSGRSAAHCTPMESLIETPDCVTVTW
jgi:hypothetical protein